MIIKKFTNASFRLEHGTSIRAIGDPFSESKSDLQELIKFLIEECGMSPAEVCQLLESELGLSPDDASRAVNAAIRPENDDDEPN